jgi:hypothetical protein
MPNHCRIEFTAPEAVNRNRKIDVIAIELVTDGK